MKKRHTLETVRNKVNDLFGEKYFIPEQEIKDVKYKIVVYCNKCEEYFNKRLNTLLSGTGHLKCRYDDIRLTLEEIQRRSKVLYDDKYTIPEQPIKNNKSTIKIYCNDCCSYFDILVYAHLKGDGGCNKCAIKKRTNSIDKIINLSKIIHGDVYEIDKNQEIKNSASSIKIYCKKCKDFFDQRVNDHLDGCGCPYCKTSKGEKIIRNFLIQNNMKFEPQKRFDGCKNKFKLPFDFYLPELNLCIEYDGIQHFRKVHNWDHEKTLINDIIKTNFCKENKIRLMRIKYDDNIIEKLEEIDD